MSGARYLLLFVGPDDAPGEWLRLEDGVIVERGSDPASIAFPVPDTDVPERIVLVAPGADVVLHWIELPSLSHAQGIAAARLRAAEFSATPAELLHVALGGAVEGFRWLAVADRERVAAWIARARAIGLDPDHILPEPLLVLPPAEGARAWDRAGLHLVRGDGLALAAEPELAALIAGEAIDPIDDTHAEAGIGEAVADMAVDLRQGSFAKRRQWRIDRAFARRLGVIAAGIAVATLLIQAVLILRYTIAADRIELETAAVARTVLPRIPPRGDASALLRDRLAQLRGGGLGFSATAGLVFAAMRDTANVELGALDFNRDGSLRVTALATSEADIDALRRRIAASGLVVEGDEPRPGGGRQIAELTMRPR